MFEAKNIFSLMILLLVLSCKKQPEESNNEASIVQYTGQYSGTLDYVYQYVHMADDGQTNCLTDTLTFDDSSSINNVTLQVTTVNADSVFTINDSYNHATNSFQIQSDLNDTIMSSSIQGLEYYIVKIIDQYDSLIIEVNEYNSGMCWSYKEEARYRLKKL
jgi:hypothetical protein